MKLLNQKGEFISGNEGETLLKIATDEAFDFAEVDDWEDAADQELVNSKKLIAEAESSFM